MCYELAWGHHLYYLHTERTLNAAEVTIGSVSSKVVSESASSSGEKMQSLLLEWIDG